MRLLGFTLTLLLLTPFSSLLAADQPNIVWITSEDNGIELGCYGDDYATTPNIDALAKMGMRYSTCWSNAPVCAPARTTIISGMYPPSMGAQHMRSHLNMPKALKMFPQYLREAGYYCTNNSKEDYNLEKPGEVWDESSRNAHWKKRDGDQPFFAVFNHTISHESQLRKRPHTAIHDPAGVTVPKYHPDTPEVRQDWAQYYDKLTEMDEKVGNNIRELKDANLLEDTIIFYYGDHGSGMPRHKRWPYDSGLHVPMIVYFPKKYEHLAPEGYSANGVSERLVSFVDLAPTVLSICGIEPPKMLQGSAFAGKFATEYPDFIFGFRGRMDERIDLVRSVRNERFVYLRQFQPHRPYGQFVHYMFQTPTTRVWYQMHLDGKLTPEQDHFWKTKPVEELYDVQNDPDEVVNLADDPEYRDTLKKMRNALFSHMNTTQDLGIIPEAELHARVPEGSPYDAQRNGQLLDNYGEVLFAAAAASQAPVETATKETIQMAFTHPENTVRYWACQWALINKEDGVSRSREQLLRRLDDESSSVRVAAAEALGQYGNEQDLQKALKVLVKAANLEESDVYTAIAALNALDNLDDKASSVRDQIAELPAKVKKMPPRTDSYVPRLLEKTLADLDGEPLP